MKKSLLRRLAATVLALCVVGGAVPMAASVAAVDMDAPADGNFSLLWVSDPQIYTKDYPDILSAQNDWVLDNANRLKIKYAIHTGDLVHTYADTSQWDFVSEEYKKWDDAGFAYGVLAGNHDMSGTDYSLYSQYFGASRYNNTDTNWWYGGDYKNNYGHYDLRSISNGPKFIFVYLSYGDHTAADYQWVNDVLKAHSDYIGVLAVHDYMATAGGRSERGEIIFEEVVLKNPNLRMVLCGHNYNSNRTVDEIDDNGDGVADRTVYQIMANYQYTTSGGNGFMRFMECDMANGTITHRTYSPYTASFGSDYEDGNLFDDYGTRDEFVTPFDFSEPTPKAAGDPESGTVVVTSEMTFAATNSAAAVTLPVAYQNKAETGTSYQGIGVYDSHFSLDAADAFTTPASLNYVVAKHVQKTTYTVTEVIKGSSLGTANVKVPVPQDGVVVALPANAGIDISSVTVGRHLLLGKMTEITTPAMLKNKNITVPTWGGVYNIDGIDRLTGNDEWVLYDSLSAQTYSHEWDMLFAFTPVSGTTYRLSAANTTLGTAKSLDVPTNGFVLSVNVCSAESTFAASMRKLFTNGLQVTLNGHQPGTAVSHKTYSLLAPSSSAWAKGSTMAIDQSGGTQSFYNTDGQWPKADYIYTQPITVDPANMVLYYDYMLETGALTNITLFFKDSKPSSAQAGQYISLQAYFEGATVEAKSGDAVGDGVRRTGKLDLTRVSIPAGCYNADGTLTVNAIRIFASGAANKKLNVYNLVVTTETDMGGEAAIPQTMSLLSNNITIADTSKIGEYVYDNGTLTVTAGSSSGYEVVMDVNRTFNVSTLKNWLSDVKATARFDIQLICTTAGADASYGFKSDFWPQLCSACDGNYIPAGTYTQTLNLESCFTANGVLPSNGITTVKQVKFLLGGAGTLTVNALQVSNGTQTGRFADGLYKTATSPSVTITSNVYEVENGQIRFDTDETALSSFVGNLEATGGSITVVDVNGKTLTNTDPVGSGAVVTVTVDGSVAAEYTVILKGDMNADGRSTLTDARSTLLVAINAYTPTSWQLIVADYNENGRITSTDARAMLLASIA